MARLAIWRHWDAASKAARPGAPLDDGARKELKPAPSAPVAVVKVVTPAGAFKTNDALLECTDVLVISDSELVCTLYLAGNNPEIFQAPSRRSR